jgi:hypothetical protein
MILNPSSAAALVVCLFLSGCQSLSTTEIGIGEKDWLRSTFIADLVYMDGNVKAYRSGGMFYYFVDGKLRRVDQGVLPAHTVRVEVR